MLELRLARLGRARSLATLPKFAAAGGGTLQASIDLVLSGCVVVFSTKCRRLLLASADCSENRDGVKPANSSRLVPGEIFLDRVRESLREGLCFMGPGQERYLSDGG